MTVAGECFNCEAKLPEDHYCHGCKKYVCEDCDKSLGMMPFGGHEPDLHLQEPDWDNL
jgi:hypothetical protein